MSLTVTAIGDNPQQPSIRAETYIPDQLIAGDASLVTDSVIIGGGAALLRGAVLGRAGFGSVTASTGTARATGSITVAQVPAAGDTVTVHGTVITFVAANPVGNQVLIGATVAATAAALAAFLIGSTDSNIDNSRYSVSGAVITVTAVVYGTAGNAYTLATSNASAFTLSGATLSGGTANTGNATVGSISAGPGVKAGDYIATCLTATTALVQSPTGEELGTATFGVGFVDPQLSFTITAGGTPCVAGDIFALTAAPGSSVYKLAAATATDGSQTPVAILADNADASGGNVTSGIYLAGEFNGRALILGPGITLSGAKDALRPLGIYVKTSVSAADPS